MRNIIVQRHVWRIAWGQHMIRFLVGSNGNGGPRLLIGQLNLFVLLMFICWCWYTNTKDISGPDRASFFFTVLKAIPWLCYKGMPPLARHAQTTYAAWPQDLRKGGSWGISRVVVVVSRHLQRDFLLRPKYLYNKITKTRTRLSHNPILTDRQKDLQLSDLLEPPPKDFLVPFQLCGVT